MPLTPNRRLQIRIAAALALVVGVNALVLSVLVWSANGVLSASGRSVPVDPDLPLFVGTVLLGAIGLVAAQARYGSWTAISGHDPDPIEGGGPRNVGARVQRLATQAAVSAPAVAIADRDEANCLTIGTQRSPTIVVTTGLLEELDDDELDAALAHEIAHLVNRDFTVVSAVAAIVAIGDRLLERERRLRGVLVSMLAFFCFTLGGLLLVPYFIPLVLVLLLFLVGPFVVISVVFLVVSAVARLLLGINAITLGLFAKTREHAADRGASHLTGDAAAVASALETLDGGERPERDARVDASATLGIVPQSLSVDRSDDGDDEDGEEGWFDRWFVGQFETWRENVSETDFDPDHSGSKSEDGFDPQWPPENGWGNDDDDDERKSWIIEPYVKPAVDPIRDRIRRVLTWRPPTHPTTEARIEQLRTLERRRHD